MVGSPGRNLDNLSLFQNLSGRGDEIYAATDGLLNLQEFLELFDPLHGVVSMGRRLTDLLQSTWNNN